MNSFISLKYHCQFFQHLSPFSCKKNGQKGKMFSMSKVIKATVNSGRYIGEIVRITNISTDEMGRQNAACLLANGSRANIKLSELTLIEEKPGPEIRKAKTASMPFISGSTSSRTLTHTKNMARNRVESKSPIQPRKKTMVLCESCGIEFNQEERKGMPGKLTQCEHCAEETESKAEGKMIFSHKTGATIEIKKDGELKYEADTFNYKNKE